MPVSVSVLRPIAAAAIGLAIASLIVLATGLLVSRGTESTTLNTSGGALFRERCIGCHEVTEGGANGFGPNLARIGVDAASRLEGLNAAEYVLQSILEPDAHRTPGAVGHMPRGLAAGLTIDELRALIEHVASLGTSNSNARIIAQVADLDIDASALEPERRVDASLALLRRGQTLFFKTLGCNACHSLDDAPGSTLVAPSLSNAARLSSTYLVESIRHPSKVITAGYRQISVETANGERVDGRLLGRTGGSLRVMVHEAGKHPEIVEFPESDIAVMADTPVSPMPPYVLPEADEAALIAFLGALEAESAGNTIQ